MISQRAKEACERMEPYPVGSAAQWARRNWNEAVLPFIGVKGSDTSVYVFTVYA